MKALLAKLIGLGPAGLFLLAILDGAGLTIPGGVDVLVVFLATKYPDSVLLLATFAVTGSLLGNLILFSIARKGGQLYIDKRTASGAGARFRKWFHHYGLLTVFIAALVPLPIMPMKIFVLCSGALGSSILAFSAVFFVARVLRYWGLAYLGSQMGDKAMLYLRQNVWYLVAFAVALFVVLYLLVKVFDRFRKPSTASA
jgi:membrane protein YqaA with SNARE-associated domain